MKSKILLLISLFFLSIGTALGQTITVKGVVLDDKGDAVIGASVRLKSNPSVGAATGLDGDFTLKANQGELIVVSFVGFKTQEVAAAPSMTIRLVPDQELLDEVVIIGYGSGRSIANTSASVVKVGSKVLAEKPTGNPFDAVQGKVAGLQVYTSSGEPSAISSMKIHGTGSLGASSSPLFIVDGMPVSSGTIQSMNPNDFESYQFLKDAAATSIYGARAANGVVYITTKRGRAGDRASITFRGQYGISTLANTNYFDEVMSSDELLDYFKKTGLKTDAAIQAIRDKYAGVNTKWYKYYYQNAPMYQADMTLSGGAGMTNYYFSAGIFNQKGLRAGSDYMKLNTRLNLNSALNEYIKFGINNSLSYDISHSSPFEGNSTAGGGIAVLAPPYYSPYDENGNEYPTLIPGWNRNNPKYIIANNPRDHKTFNLSTVGNVTITPVEGLTLRSQAGVEFSDYIYSTTSMPSYIPNKGIGTARRYFSRTVNFSTNNTIEYKFNVADDHNFTVLGGHEFVDYTSSNFNAQGSGLNDDRLILLSHLTKDKAVNEEFTQYAFLSYFGQLSYDYQQRYFIDFVVRNDASSRFGRNKRNGVFWSVGLLWKAKKEAFLKDLDWINDLDVKFSTGTQGNAGIGNYQARATAGKIGQYRGEVGWGLGNPGNPDLAWERQSKTTVGINTRLFNRLGINLEYYYRLTSDMLMDVPQPYTTGLALDNLGFASITSNVGKYLNTGIDLRIDVDILKGKAHDLAGYINFNYNKDKVVELFQGRDSWILPGYGFGYIVGQPVVFVQPLYKGVNSETGHPEWYLPGDNIAITTKDDTKVTNVHADILEQNTGIPLYTPMTGGFGLNGNFKGFYAQLDFSFALGKHMISNDKFFYENLLFINQGLNGRRNTGDYWQKPGDKTEFPSLDYIYNISGGVQTWFDSKMIENASFMRLKNLTIGYNVPTKLLEKQDAVKNAKIFFTGRNLLTFTKYGGPDPEVDSNLSFGANPNTMQFVIGAELTF